MTINKSNNDNYNGMKYYFTDWYYNPTPIWLWAGHFCYCYHCGPIRNYIVIHRCPMYRFHGQMTPVAVKMFPKTLQDLRISVANSEQYFSLCHYLSEVKTHLPLLANFSELHLVTIIMTGAHLSFNKSFTLYCMYRHVFWLFSSRITLACVCSQQGTTSTTSWGGEVRADNQQNRWPHSGLGMSSRLCDATQRESVGFTALFLSI